MARVVVYTSPARGHLYPIMGPATELSARGHEVHVVTLSGEADLVRSQGLFAEAIDHSIESREMDDYKGKNPMEALALGLATFADRAPLDRADLHDHIDRVRPDSLIVDTNSWGALAAAEASGLPWCSFQPYFTPLPSLDTPPFGPGLALAKGPFGRFRDRLLRPLTFGRLSKIALPAINQMREAEGLDPASSMEEVLTRPPLTLYFTAEPFEYPRRDWPESYQLVGAGSWAPPSTVPEWLGSIDRPIVLVTCSTERQSDAAILQTALTGLAQSDVFVVGTSGAQDPDVFDVPPNARVERFLSHGPIVERAAAVVCHGGMGITQRALLQGVPPVVIPFGRDQLEVARRVERAGAGVRLNPKKLTPDRLREAVDQARDRVDGARRVAEAFRQAGADSRAADLVEGLIEGTVDSGRSASTTSSTG
jgi:MGT family glycosyltransferase